MKKGWLPAIEICHCAGKLYYQIPFIRFEVLSPHLPTVHHMKGCLILNNTYQLEHLYQHGFYAQDVFLKRHVQLSKCNPVVNEVEFIEANPSYEHIQHKNGS